MLVLVVQPQPFLSVEASSYALVAVVDTLLVALAGEPSSLLHTDIGTKVITSVVVGTCVYLPVLEVLEVLEVRRFRMFCMSTGLAGN
jgi:hypothetical protein